jgi:hypothetical protein
MDVSTQLLFAQSVGPFGLLMLAGLFVVLRYGPRRGPDARQMDTYHEQNQATLRSVNEGIQKIEGEVRGGLRRVEEQLLKLNGRLGKVEEWRDAHNKQDDERYERDQDAKRGLADEINRVREHVHETRGLMSPLMLDRDLRHRRGGGGD